MRSARALTLVETLVAVAIISVLAAIVYPVISSSVERGRQTGCTLQLRQLGQAMALYRSTEGGDGIYDEPYRMGLPPWPPTDYVVGIFELGRCNGPSRASGLAKDGFAYYYIPTPVSTGGSFAGWREYAQQQRDLAVLFFDTNHNAPDVPLESAATTKFTLSVSLDTSIWRRYAQGSIWDLGYWRRTTIYGDPQ